MYLFRWAMPIASVAALFLGDLEPARAGGITIRGYGAAPVVVAPTGGASSYSYQSYGFSTNAVPSGAGTYQFAPSGFQSFGVGPAGFGTFGVTPFGLDSFQTFGAAPFAGGTFGTTPLTFSTTSFRGSRSRVPFVAPPLLVPVAPGGSTSRDGAGGGDLANEIKQIKERLISVENDVKAIKDRLPPVKPKENPTFTSDEVKRQLEKLRSKYEQYVKDLDTYNKELEKLRVAKEAAVTAWEADRTNAQKKKALDDTAAAYKKFMEEKKPTPPTVPK